MTLSISYAGIIRIRYAGMISAGPRFGRAGPAPRVMQLIYMKKKKKQTVLDMFPGQNGKRCGALVEAVRTVE